MSTVMVVWPGFTLNEPGRNPITTWPSSVNAEFASLTPPITLTTRCPEVGCWLAPTCGGGRQPNRKHRRGAGANRGGEKQHSRDRKAPEKAKAQPRRAQAERGGAPSPCRHREGEAAHHKGGNRQQRRCRNQRSRPLDADDVDQEHTRAQRGPGDCGQRR